MIAPRRSPGRVRGPSLTVGLIAAMAVAILPASTVQPALAVSPNIVISQIYGGGGNTGATMTHDYIELFNRGSSAVSLSGWSVQYASAQGTGNFGSASSQISELPDVVLQPGQYLLVQGASTAAVGAPLPTPDVTDATPLAMSATAGKVALTNIATSLGCNGAPNACSASQLASIVDLVGYGSSFFYEGSGPTPILSAAVAAFRASAGCTDTDDNATDFAPAAPAPRNTASPVNLCPLDEAPIVSSTSPANGAPGVDKAASIAITFSEAVSLADPWFTIECTLSGAHTAAVGGGAAAYTLDPVTNFTGGETCAVTVVASSVTDADVLDPPEAMAADFAFSFTIATGCGDAFTPIPAIQGSGPAAAITGNVTTEGVVVGDFEGTASVQGFYLQDPTGDGDTATSDGIFVFTGAANTVAAGDLVRVTGYARERFTQTALNGSNSNSAAVPAANITICGSGTIPATDVTLPFDTTAYPERFEGMLVRFPQALVISEYFNYERFGEIVLAQPLPGEDRAFTPTAIDEPGAPALARADLNLRSRITLDDAVSAQNPPSLRHPNGQPFSLTNRFRGGDTVANTVGVLGFDFSLYRIFPTGPADYTSVNPRPAAPDPVGGTLRAATMNTLNFFLTLDYPTGDPLDNTCGAAQNVECRGADSNQPLEFTRQRDKLLAAIAGLDADIIGLNELENTPGVEPLLDPTNGIVAGLNAMPGVGPYDAIDTGVIGTDAIRVGLIYRSDKVRPVGDFKILDSTVDPRFLDTKSRPVLAQTFEEIATGARITVAANHLKSKGSDCNDVGDPDAGDGQGNCNLTRTAAAKALVDWLAADPTGSGDRDYLILGDLNSYAKEDPIDAIRAGADDVAGTADDYTNLVAQYQGPFAYSYVFDGQAGYLDYVLASATLVGQVTGAADWHINADEPDLLDYDTSFKPPEQDAIYEPNAYRSSDHDPVVVGLNLQSFGFSGFNSPVDNPPVINTVNAGRGIPVKFSLSGDLGLDVFFGTPMTAVFTCGSGGLTDEVDTAITAGASGLTYDPATGEYTYVWNTQKAWAGQCRTLTVTFDDGAYRSADFQFR